jgi:prophage tail gpP-like protein
VPNPSEVAQLNVAGVSFSDWESVWVQHRRAEPFSQFRFTAVERGDPPHFYALLQFKPGDPCTIMLGGETAITGLITTRQVAYDANSHGIQLMGKSLTAWGAKSSVNTTTGNFDGMPVEKVVRKVLEPYNGVKTIGDINPRPFDKLQAQKGEKNWDFCERICRPRGVIMGSDPFGNFLVIDTHTPPTNMDLVEGVNILKLQCIVNHDNVYTTYTVSGQTSASDDQNGTDSSEQERSVGGNTTKVKSVLITPAEQPVKTLDEIFERAKNEAVWHEGDVLQATVVVQGWFQGGSLWQVGAVLNVKSPMAILDQTMCIQTATFQQDNDSGTTTTLELVPPWLLKATAAWNVGNAGAPSEPGAPPTPEQTVPPVETGQPPKADATPAEVITGRFPT